jgi:hypothetical protein
MMKKKMSRFHPLSNTEFGGQTEPLFRTVFNVPLPGDDPVKQRVD